MHKWKIKYLLKNGEYVFGIYHGSEDSSDKVAKVLLSGDSNTFNGCRGTKDDSTLLVRNGDIAAIEIS